MLRLLLAAAVLSLSVAAAHAAPFSFDQTYYYETSYDTPAASGTAYSKDGLPQVGGLCSPFSGALSICPVLVPSTGPLVFGTGTAGATGQIPLTTKPGGPWDMAITVTNLSTTTSLGNIWEVTLDGTKSLGVTTILALASGGCNLCETGTFDVPVAGNTAYTLEITDLLEQFINTAGTETDNLPGLLGDPGLDGGTVPNSPSYDNSILQLTVTLTPAPEPASLALLCGAVTLLGALRRSRPSQSAGAPARQG